MLGIAALPAALTCALILGVLPSALGRPAPTVWQAMALGGIGTAVMVLWSLPVVWVGLAAGALVFTWPFRAPGRLRRVVPALAVLALGYLTVWNLNYLAALLTPGRLYDSYLMRLDLWLFGVRDYVSVFPLVTTPTLFRLFEAGYLFLFTEIMAVTCVIVLTGGAIDVRRWVGALFSAYAVGLLVFALFPTVGPPIFAPDSFDRAAWGGTITGQILVQLGAEYTNVLGGSPLNGFGYFIAAPSLHVAVATLCQHRLGQWPWMFWAFLPANAVLIASTVVLGHHYVVDLPAGVLLAALIIVVAGRHATPPPARHARPLMAE